jgi:hypothetical protein
MITGFCTAINPIDFTLWSTIVLVFGIMIGILLSSLYRYCRKTIKAVDDDKTGYYPIIMEFEDNGILLTKKQDHRRKDA